MEEMECGIEKKAAAMAAAEEVGRKEEAAAGDVGLMELSRKLNDFAKARDWEQYHSPRNLLLAMVRIVSFPHRPPLDLLSLLFLAFITNMATFTPYMD
jgi:hypothetical protein